MDPNQSHVLDPATGITLLAVFGLVWIGLGIWWGRRAKDNEGFMLAGRNVGLALGTATAMLAAEKKASDIAGMPVVNMWCTHRPKLKKPVAMRATTMRLCPASGVPVIDGRIIDTAPAAGRKMM